MPLRKKKKLKLKLNELYLKKYSVKISPVFFNFI